MATGAKKPVMDVTKPGDSPADATARPIITGHEMMKDPMVNAEAATKPATLEAASSEDAQITADAAPSASHKVIKPIESTPDETTDKPADSKVEEAEKPKPAEESVTEDAVVDAVLEQVGDKQQESKEDEEARKRQELVDKLTEEKKYFLPINQVRTRRNNRIVLIILTFLLVALLGLVAAADAGYIKPGFTLPFDFIKDKQTATKPSETPATTQQKTDANPLITVNIPQVKTTSDYTDPLKIYSLKYPSNWTVIPQADGNDKQLPSQQVTSNAVNFVYPNSVQESGVTVTADSTDALAKSITANWQDNKHTPEKKVINGYSVQYVQVVFKGDAESYTDENYLFTKNGATVFVSFRQKYFHQFPAQNWDASQAMPGFETILNSIKFLN